MALKGVISEQTVLYSLKLVYPKRRHICMALKVVTSQETVLFIHIKEPCISNGLQKRSQKMVILQVVKEFSALRKLHSSGTRIRQLSQMHPVHALRSCLIYLFRIKFLIKIFFKKSAFL